MTGTQRRQQIVATAGRLFSEHGYAGTSMRVLARELDLQGGSLYAHIASKEEVLWDLVEQAGRRFLEGVEPLASGPGSAEDRLRAMVRAHLVVVTDPALHASVFLNEWKFLSVERRGDVLALRDAYEALFERVLAEGAADGEFVIRDVKAAARYLLSALNGVPVWYRPDGPLAPQHIADSYTDLFLDGMKGQAVPAAQAVTEGASDE